MKIEAGTHYMRRRDKVLVQVHAVNGQGVEYKTKPALTAHKVSLDGFRKGFRPLTEEEKRREGIASTANPSTSTN